MIVKFNRWKKAEFKKLLKYIDDDKGRGKGSEYAIFHNITIPKLEDAISEFQENDQYRKKRNGGVAIYHEILSFHEKDTSHLTPDVLDDIAKKYIELRGESALCFAKAHIDDKHIHIHFAFSGTECFSSKTLRLDNKAFRRVKHEIEKYQMLKYPELSHSVVYHKQNEKRKKKSDREYQLKKRTQKETDKEFIRSSFDKEFQKSVSFYSFLENLKKDGFEVYLYRNKPNGVLYNGRKFRFRTLGFGHERFKELEQKIKTLNQFREVLKKKHIESEIKRNVISEAHLYRDELRDTISNQKKNIVLKKRELRNIQRRHFRREIRR
jgi:hypothetical protein